VGIIEERVKPRLEREGKWAREHEEAGRLIEEFSYDPDVERMLEGVAFLTGRIRQKLDDELPEISHALVRILWPQYLRPIPSAGILEFVPRENMLRTGQLIPRFTEVASEPMKSAENTVCVFRTSCDVILLPIQLEKVLLEYPKPSESALRLRFRLEEDVSLSLREMSYLRLHLHGQRELTTALYYWLLRRTRELDLELFSDSGVPRKLRLSPDAVSPAGWRDDESLLDYGANAFPGYRYLQEYFALPEKFLFLDVRFPAADDVLLESRFDLVFRFQEIPPAYFRPTENNIRLHCTPIVNLFETNARPIRLDHLQHEYRVQVDASPEEHFEVYSIDEVTSFCECLNLGKTLFHFSPANISQSPGKEDILPPGIFWIETRS